MQQKLTNMAPLEIGRFTSLIWFGFCLHTVSTAVSEKEQGSEHRLLRLRVLAWGNKLGSHPLVSSRGYRRHGGQTSCCGFPCITPCSHGTQDSWAEWETKYHNMTCARSETSQQEPIQVGEPELVPVPQWYELFINSCELGKHVVLSLYWRVWRTCEEAFLLWLGLAEVQSTTAQLITWEPKINWRAAVDDRKLSVQRQWLEALPYTGEGNPFFLYLSIHSLQGARGTCGQSSVRSSLAHVERQRICSGYGLWMW